MVSVTFLIYERKGRKESRSYILNNPRGHIFNSLAMYGGTLYQGQLLSIRVQIT